jgi:hypothetical protein
MNFIFLNNVFLEGVIMLGYVGFFQCPLLPQILERFR